MERHGKNVILKPRYTFDRWQANEAEAEGPGLGGLVGRSVLRTKALSARSAAEERRRVVSLKAAVGTIRKVALAAKEALVVERRPQGQPRATRPVLQPRGARRASAALQSAHAAGLRATTLPNKVAESREEPLEERAPPSPAASLLSVGSSVIAELSAPRGGVTTAAPVTPLPPDFSPEPASGDEVQHVPSAGSSSATSPHPGSRETVRRKAPDRTKVATAQRTGTKGLRSHQEASRRPLASAARATVVAATLAAAASIRAVDEPAKAVTKRRLAATAVESLRKAARPARPAGARGTRPVETTAVRPAKAGATETVVRKKRRITKTRGAAGTEAAAVAGAAVLGRQGESSALTASTSPGGKKQSSATQGKAPAAQAAAARASTAAVGSLTPEAPEDLNESEQRELKAAVLAQLQKAICADVEDATVLADFICVLVDQHKTREEMTAELAFFHEEAEPFVAWVEERRAELLARRHAAAAFGRSRRRRAAAAVAAELGSASAQQPDSAGGEADLGRRPHEAAATSAAAPAARGPAPGAASRGQPYVVVTDRLVLQPNPTAVPAGGGAAAAGGASANERRMELLAEMTKKLQEILGKLADKALDDAGRERYQAMAQTIQAQLTALSGVGKPARS